MSAGSKTIFLTLFLAASLYLTGNSRVQLWDRDEPRYAECSRQMLESGDWVVPRLYDKLRFQKPPLIYWCQATAMKFIGSEGDDGAFAARLPSVIAALMTLALLAVLITRRNGSHQARWTVFILATSAMLIVSAKSCLTDGVLVLFITGAQLCFFALWRGNRSWTVVILLAIALGLGMLAKGPFIVGIVASTAAALFALHLLNQSFIGKNRWGGNLPGIESVRAACLDPADRTATQAAAGESTKELNLPSGNQDRPTASPSSSSAIRTCAQFALVVLIVAAIVTPWIHLVSKRAPDFLPAMLHEGKQHTLEGKEGHHFPPGYHLVMVWPMFMPWSLLLPLAIGTALRNRHLPEIRFALAAVIGPWLMVEFMGTKLPHYFLPAYPALAYLVAFAIRRCMSGESKGLESPPFQVAAAFWALAVACVGAIPWLALRWFRPLPWDSMIALSILCLILGAAVVISLGKRRFVPAFIIMGIGMCMVIGIASRLFAQADYLRISKHIANTLVAHGATHPGDVKMVDYKEPSLAFYQGGTIREVEKKADLIYKPANQWPHWVVITRQAWNMVPPATQSHFRQIDSCRGWAYADQSRVLEVIVVENSVY